MDRIKQYVIRGLRQSREELLAINKDSLTFVGISQWFERWRPTFLQAEGGGGPLIDINIREYVKGHQAHGDVDVLDEVRSRIIGLIDRAIVAIDTREVVRPVLDELILKVKDTKLAALLKEFNSAKDANPNLAAIGFRTIMSLIIRERAKLVKSSSTLATKDDLAFEPDIRLALQEKIFGSAEEKLLQRFLTGGKKDALDNVAHKPGVERVASKDDLSDAVDLLNRLLPTVI